jgi:tRNA wybutosine-synthesizing protein 2
MTDRLAAIVEKTRAEAAIDALRAEGVYDDDRSVFEAGDEAVGIPVTRRPERTEVRELRREGGEPRARTLSDHLRERGWTEGEVERAPGSWAVVGSVILVAVADCPRPAEFGEALLATHGGVDTVLAREGIDGTHREPEVRVLAGEGDTETVHREHGTEYALDLAAVMFSPGNKAERRRMGEVVETGEAVLDMFAGVGYFALPMARAGARVTAVERNPAAFEYLLENSVRNGVTDRVAAYRGDCREVVPELGAFDRVVMGFYDATAPAGSEAGAGDDAGGTEGAADGFRYLPTALDAVREGGTVHAHEVTPNALVPDRPVERVERAADGVGRRVEAADVREVKGYSEGVTHVVVDARVA